MTPEDIKQLRRAMYGSPLTQIVKATLYVVLALLIMAMLSRAM
jgi:hypothetical protein